MLARQWVIVGFRLFALWLVVAAFQSYTLVSTAQRMAAAGMDDSPWFAIAIVGMFLGVAIVVWALSTPLSGLITTGLPPVEGSRAAAVDMAAVGCVLMGLWWIKDATIPLLGMWVKAIALAPETGQSAFALLGMEGKAAMGLHVLQIGIGVFFIARPYVIASRLVNSVARSSHARNHCGERASETSPE